MPLTNMSTDHRQLFDAGLGSVLLDPEPKVFNCRDMTQALVVLCGSQGRLHGVHKHT